MKRTLIPTLVLAALVGGCGGSESPAEPETSSLLVYSGRSESLIGPILEKFRETSGTEVNVRYGSTSEMAATLLEEAANTPADVFISQDAAALGALGSAGMLTVLDAATLDRVEPRFRSDDGNWIGLSGRARVVVYNTELTTPADLPQSLWDVVDKKYEGRFGIAPANGSLQAHLAAVQALEGPERLAEWLDGVVANDPQIYPNNRTIVEATLNGEVEWGLVNHYYLWRAIAEDPDVPGRNFFMPSGDVSGFINVAGVGILSDNPAAAELVDYLLDDEAQTYFSKETHEYPLVPGVAASVDLVPLDEMPTGDVDFAEVSSQLEGALKAIQASRLLPG